MVTVGYSTIQLPGPVPKTGSRATSRRVLRYWISRPRPEPSWRAAARLDDDDDGGSGGGDDDAQGPSDGGLGRQEAAAARGQVNA